MTLTLNFHGQIWNLLYLSQKRFDCHKMKSRHIDRTQGLKCDHWVWPWPWPWPWIFQGQIWNWLYLSQKWSYCHEAKSKHIDWTLSLKSLIEFDLGHDPDLEFSRSNMEFAISQPKMVRLPRNEKQTYRLNFRPQMWPSSLTLAMTLTVNFQGQIWNLLLLNQKWSKGQV